MKIAVPKERRDAETRVAATPDTVKKLIGLGFDVAVESGAGAMSSISDSDYTEVGATIAADSASLLGDADLVFKVQRPTDEEIAAMKDGAKLVSILSPFNDPDQLGKYNAKKIESMAMEFMPRITRAQSMDVLSSQSNLAGYKAVIDAAAEFTRAMPMMMTAAGTVAPARVFVFGAGVAGLQAIATAKRLGAIVSATDVRPAAKEQVESLGADFVMVESEETKEAETSGGYAKEMSEDYQRQQAELIAKTITKQDIAICTALIPGRAAPTLISEEMVASMKPGSIIVDLAVEQGGNCPLSKLGEIVTTDNGVKILGHANVPGRVAVDSSQLYAKNLLNFLSAFIDGESGALALDPEDEIIQGITLTRDGATIHPQFAEAS